jgi:hypothetical protein
MFFNDDGKWEDWRSYILEPKWRPTHWRRVPEGPSVMATHRNTVPERDAERAVSSSPASQPVATGAAPLGTLSLPSQLRCAECSCSGGGADCNWIASPAYSAPGEDPVTDIDRRDLGHISSATYDPAEPSSVLSDSTN